MNQITYALTLLAMLLSQQVAAAEMTDLQRKALRYFAPLPEQMPGAEKDTPALVALGRQLYFEPRLSINDTQSCNSCHRLDTSKSGVDNLPVSIGARGERGTRNAPTVLNAGWHASQFWDGRAKDLVEQAKGPILNPIEMGMPDEQAVENKLRAIDEYRVAFAQVFPDTQQALTYDNIARAIAAFERTLRTEDRFDLFLQGDSTALNEQEQRGLAHFIGLNCVSCHDGVLLGGELFERLGKENDYENQSDTGLYALTKDEDDKMVFKVSSLRNIALTAPYYHDGKVATLEEAVSSMAWLQMNRRLEQQEVADIVAFLNALTGKLQTQE